MPAQDRNLPPRVGIPDAHGVVFTLVLACRCDDEPPVRAEGGDGGLVPEQDPNLIPRGSIPDARGMVVIPVASYHACAVRAEGGKIDAAAAQLDFVSRGDIPDACDAA